MHKTVIVSAILALACFTSSTLAADPQDPSTLAAGSTPIVDSGAAEEPVSEADPAPKEDDTPWALPAYVFVVSTGQSDVGIFTPLLTYDSRIIKGHTWRVGTFVGAKLTGPGLTLSLFKGVASGKPAEISGGVFYLSSLEDLFNESQLSVGFTVRVLF